MNKTVLLVEDELIVALDLQMTVEEVGLSINGPYGSLIDTERALSHLSLSTLACAILDIQLADGNIFTIANKLRDEGVPIIFHSGNKTDHKLKEQYPNASFLEKPSNEAVLKQILSQYQ
ncbi:response regulator [Swingsia samuiensis]|uniref:Response regulator n=1 Tax=Swingsia samuiensis TaxID=1293412 RepID=A0A4Y6UKF5_9PROT|nr:response regulator [Swingsia samuiensis]QDH17128.1 response regulator [Swingsia samuiensis]